MTSDQLPALISKIALDTVPYPFTERAVSHILDRVRLRHPKLFKNLSQLPKATIALEPTDVRYNFLLHVGYQPVGFSVVLSTPPDVSASVQGSLQDMVDMLEGRIDGDSLFFSRGIRITGDTSAIVALRNTLDREEINLLSEITSIFGPFAQPAKRLLFAADRFAGALQGRLRSVHSAMHAKERGGEP